MTTYVTGGNVKVKTASNPLPPDVALAVGFLAIGMIVTALVFIASGVGLVLGILHPIMPAIHASATKLSVTTLSSNEGFMIAANPGVCALLGMTVLTGFLLFFPGRIRLPRTKIVGRGMLVIYVLLPTILIINAVTTFNTRSATVDTAINTWGQQHLHIEDLNQQQVPPPKASGSETYTITNDDGNKVTYTVTRQNHETTAVTYTYTLPTK